MVWVQVQKGREIQWMNAIITESVNIIIHLLLQPKRSEEE